MTQRKIRRPHPLVRGAPSVAPVVGWTVFIILVCLLVWLVATGKHL